MGQRLNIEIIHNHECVANAYYHWSAYTTSSIDLAIKVLSEIDKVNEANIKIKAIRLLESTGAGLTEEELNLLSKDLADVSFAPCNSRNDGLIAISDKEIENTRSWEEGRITVYLETKSVDFQVLNIIDEDDYEDYEIDIDDIPECNFGFSIENMSLENLIKFRSFIETREQENGCFKMNSCVYCSIY